VLLFTGYVTNYTSKLLARCQAELHAPSYPDIAYHAFGSLGKVLMAVALYLELFAYMCVFLVLQGSNLHHLHPSTGAHGWMVLCFLCMLPPCFLRELRFMSYVSLLGTGCSLLLTALVLGYACVDLWGLQAARRSGQVTKNYSHKLIDLWGLAMCFGLVMCAFAGHAVVPSLYEAMRERQRFDAMINVTYTLCMLCYVAVAGLGYLTYGEVRLRFELIVKE
jgi:vesicular inhibitory amino acid transporter